MDKRPHIVVFGDSVLMDGVAASLIENRSMSLERLIPSENSHLESLQLRDPDVVLCEVNVSGMQALIHLLLQNPGTPFVVLNSTNSQMIVINSCRHNIQSLDELTQMVQAMLFQDACV